MYCLLHYLFLLIETFATFSTDSTCNKPAYSQSNNWNFQITWLITSIFWGKIPHSITNEALSLLCKGCKKVSQQFLYKDNIVFWAGIRRHFPGEKTFKRLQKIQNQLHLTPCNETGIQRFYLLPIDNAIAQNFSCCVWRRVGSLI